MMFQTMHVERIRYAGMILDKDLYGGHTAFSDFLRAGALYMVLKGEWFHRGVGRALPVPTARSTATLSFCAGVLYLVLKGEWFHRRVASAYSLVHNIFVDCELLCANLKALEGKAVYFVTDACKSKL